MLTKLNARRRGLDLLELAANVDRCLRLGIERFVVAHAAPSVDDDTGLGLAPPRLRDGLCLKERWQGQPSQTHTGTQKIPSCML